MRRPPAASNASFSQLSMQGAQHTHDMDRQTAQPQHISPTNPTEGRLVPKPLDPPPLRTSAR